MALNTDISKPIRLDKWLWAARFFKTRGLAKQAIVGGKIRYDGQRIKPGKEVKIGAELTIRQGFDVKIVVVLELASQRVSAKEAALLYEETLESKADREKNKSMRQLSNALVTQSHKRPDKKERRETIKFKRDNLE